MEPEPCNRCNQLTSLTLGTEALCVTCRDAVLDPIRERVLVADGFVGWGRIESPDPATPGWGLCRCVTCTATWIGRDFDACGWCERTRQNVVTHQAELVLQPPDLDPDDIRYIDAMHAWAVRMKVAADAGTVTPATVEAAWRRATRGPRDVAA